MNEAANSIIFNPYIRFVSLTKNCNDEFYVGNLKKFSPRESIRTSGYRKWSRGKVCVTIKDKKTGKLLCDSSEILSPCDICTFVSFSSDEKIFLAKIKEVNEIRDPGYAYLKIYYAGFDNRKINITFRNTCFCRDITSGEVSKYIGFVPGEYRFSVKDSSGKTLALTENVTLENGKCYTIYVTADNGEGYNTLITTDVGNPECFWMLK